MTSPASATLAYAIGGVEQPPEYWQDAEHPHAGLSAIGVFDSACASVHINKKNEMAFCPFGLDVPDEFAKACQTVREALTREKHHLERMRNPILSNSTWNEATPAGRALQGLSHKTDFSRLKMLGTLAEDELVRLDRLREDLSKEPQKAAAEQTLKAGNLSRLFIALKAIAAQTDDRSLTAIFSLDSTARRNREAARIAASRAFSNGPLKGVGGDTWRSLWESARRYSTQLAYPAIPYPPSETEMYCLLCQQPLQAEAIARMAKFEEFIQQDTEKLAQLSEVESKAALDSLASLYIGLPVYKAYIQELAIQNRPLARKVRRFFASARLRRYVLIRSLGSEIPAILPGAVEDPMAEISMLETSARDHATVLKNSAGSAERMKIEAEFAGLRDRALLNSMMAIVEEEIKRLRELEFLERCVNQTNTAAITKLGNELADRVVTPKLQARFKDEIKKLAAEKVRVELVRSGGKYGCHEYQLRLSANPGAKVGGILSEGEQTCVAVAAFLAELATASGGSALVFDDPVSSLDHRWRKQVAKRLVEEAENRQVIVFTHDLILATDLEDFARLLKRPVSLVSVARGSTGAGIVHDNLPWKGKRLEDRIDKLEKEVRSATSLYTANEEDRYNIAVAAIYNKMRTSWERGIEDIAFAGVVLRHRDYINTKDLLKVTALDESDCEIFCGAWKRCCEITDSHDGSRGRSATAPSPNEILDDINVLKDWVGSLKSRHKRIEASRPARVVGAGAGDGSY
jgi:hypothetical protein